MSEQADNGPGELDRPTQLIRIREVQYRTGLGRSTIYRWMAQGKFPKPQRLGNHCVAWRETVIEDWMHQILDDGPNEMDRFP
jgi:prophage regulatory protein